MIDDPVGEGIRGNQSDDPHPPSLGAQPRVGRGRLGLAQSLIFFPFYDPDMLIYQ
jgi:hypothetical protein